MSLPAGLVALILLLGGLAMTFRGHALFKVVLPLTGFFVVAGFTAALARPYAGGDTLAVLGAAFIGGALGAALVMAAFLYGLFLFGAAFGWYAGLSLAAWFEGSPLSVATVSMVIGGVAAVLARKPLIIVATSVWGAMVALAGVQVWTGRLVAERLAEPGTLLAIIQRADAPALAVAILTIAGILVQLRPDDTVVVA